jgi:uncharacterized cupredoxin-like copper-binding protein
MLVASELAQRSALMKTRIVGTTLLLGLFVLAMTGCGAKTAAASKASGPTTVTITLTEFKITSSLTTFTVGTPYHFVVTNGGQAQHELMVMPAAKGTASEDERDAAELFEISELDPGQTGAKDFTFTSTAPAGVLEMACHVPGHYESNMRLPIVVQ